MNDVKIMMGILFESLDKKRDALELINKITEKQKVLIQDTGFLVEQFNGLVGMKQTKIEEIQALDDGFVATYNRVKTYIINQQDVYKDDVLKLKEKIKAVGELGIAIQVNEMRNKRLLDIKHTNEKNRTVQEGALPSQQLVKKRMQAYTEYNKNNPKK
jgi:hypothetical protein